MFPTNNSRLDATRKCPPRSMLGFNGKIWNPPDFTVPLTYSRRCQQNRASEMSRRTLCDCARFFGGSAQEKPGSRSLRDLRIKLIDHPLATRVPHRRAWNLIRVTESSFSLRRFIRPSALYIHRIRSFVQCLSLLRASIMPPDLTGGR